MTPATDRVTGWQPSEDDLAILRLLAAGGTTSQVARAIGTSERTVRRRLRVLADDLAVETTIEVLVRAAREGLV
jgi:DNA-binding NarL/FixJ family response regulator